MKLNHLIYKTTNNLNSKVYIGVHSTKNINDSYLGSGTYLKSAISKHGSNNFTKEILFNFNTRKEALLKEEELVNNDFVLDSNTYNLKLGGGGAPLLYGDKNKTDSELKKRLVKYGFKTMGEFSDFMVDFSVYDVLIKQENKEPVTKFAYDFANYKIQDGFIGNKKKMKNYRKHHKDIIRIMQYIVYGY